MLQPEIDDDPILCRLHIRITPEAYELLDAEAKRRVRLEARHCPPGAIINELIVKALSPKRMGRPPKAQPKPMRSTKRIQGKTA